MKLSPGMFKGWSDLTLFVVVVVLVGVLLTIVAIVVSEIRP